VSIKAAAIAVVVAVRLSLTGCLVDHNWEDQQRTSRDKVTDILSGMWLSMLTQLIGIICFSN